MREDKCGWAVAVLSVGLVVGCSLAKGAAIASGTHTVDVADPDYRMPAYTVGVPTGWKFAGEVAREAGCHGKGPMLKSSAVAPDGTAIAYLPGFRWNWTTSPLMRESMQKSGCATIDINTAAGFLVNIAVPNLRPNATLRSILPLEPAALASIATQLEQARHSNEAMANRYGVKPQRLSIEGARVRFTYELEGKHWEEQVQTIIDCTESQMPGLYSLPPYSNRQCSARNLYIVRAPQGQLEAFLAAPALAALNQQTQTRPEWVQRVTQDEMAKFQASQQQNAQQFQAMLRNGQQQHDALMRRGEQFQANEKAEFTKSQALVQAQRTATSDMAHRQVLDSLGRQEFTNPNTGQVIQASAYYDHQWMSSDGSTLIQTNNPSLDPNGAVYPVSQSWTELVPR